MLQEKKWIEFLFTIVPHFPRNPFILSFKVLLKVKAGIFNKNHLRRGFHKDLYAENLLLLDEHWGKLREVCIFKKNSSKNLKSALPPLT